MERIKKIYEKNQNSGNLKCWDHLSMMFVLYEYYHIL